MAQTKNIRFLSAIKIGKEQKKDYMVNLKSGQSATGPKRSFIPSPSGVKALGTYTLQRQRL